MTTIRAGGVKGPASATDGGLTVFDGTGGKTIKEHASGAPGTAAFKNTGTSGNNVPLLDGTNTWSGAQTLDPATQTIIDLKREAGNGDFRFRIYSDTAGSAARFNSQRFRGTESSSTGVSTGDALFISNQSAYNGTLVEAVILENRTVENANVTGSGNHPSGRLSWFTRGAADTSQFAATAEMLRLIYNAAYFPSVGTTGSAANAFLDSGSSPANSLLRSTSSERYKDNIEALESWRADDFLDRAVPIFYRSLARGDKLPAGAQKTFYGFTAEALAKIDPRLVSWGYADEDYEIVQTGEKTEEVGQRIDERTGKTVPIIETFPIMERKLKEGVSLKPDGVAYERLTVFLFDIVKRQRDDIAALDARIAALETARR